MLNELDTAVFKDQGVTLNVTDFKAEWVFSSSDSGFVLEGVVSNQAVVVELQIVIIKGLRKDRTGFVRCCHHEVHALDVVPAKGVSDIDRKLHVSELRSMCRRPFSHLWF